MIHLTIYKEKINHLRNKPLNIDDFKELNSNTKLSENIIFYLYEEVKPNIYEKLNIISPKYIDEKFSVEIFESIDKKVNNTCLSRIIYKSLFTDRELIIEKLNINYKASIEEMQKDLEEEIQFLIKKNIPAINLFLQINNKFYRCQESYDVFIKEIMKLLLLLMMKNKKNEIKQISEKEKPEKKDVDIIDSYKEKEKENIINNSINSEIREALNQIIEKENKIKELELKLSRYPFELNESEKIMTVIIKSIDNKIIFPILCKNTFIFNRIEENFCAIYKEYSEKDNIFTLNGNKINKNETLENNKIKDKDIIIIESN